MTTRSAGLTFRRVGGPLAVAGIAILALSSVAGPAAASTHSLPASIGSGVEQTHATPASVTDALRCARPAHDVHFKRHRAIVAVAVGMAESYCEPHAEGHNPPSGNCPNGSTDRGLWQINSCYHPEVKNRCAYKPDCNARAAKHISDGGRDWSPWSAYNNGAYKTYLEVAKQAVVQVW